MLLFFCKGTVASRKLPFDPSNAKISLGKKQSNSKEPETRR